MSGEFDMQDSWENSPPAAQKERREIKIGSQRDLPPPAAPSPDRPAEPQVAETGGEAAAAPTLPQPVEAEASAAPRAEPQASTPGEVDPASPLFAQGSPRGSFPPPRMTRVSAELQREIDDALGGFSVEQLLQDDKAASQPAAEPEIDQRLRASVVKVHREDVFFALPGHYEGVASLRQFDHPPEPGAALEVVVTRFNSEEGLYEVSVPGASAQVHDWSDLAEGLIVEARVTGHNSGGLECEVHNIRGFIPVSQVALYRVEDCASFVGEKFPCLVTEANPARGNLVLSRRAVLEREQQEEKDRLLGSLEVGQIREGVVRSLRDFGAFVDLGGVDGLIHISKLSWDRVAHAKEVLEEGQRVQVQIEKIDPQTGRIGLTYRDLMEHPWQRAREKYAENAVVTGTVSKVMDFGAFVRLEAGIEGLVHISELAHHRVGRVGNVVQEGQEVRVKILSIDAENQRMSLSIKAALAAAEAAADAAESAEEADEPPREKVVKPHPGSLKGGINRATGGEQFGLKW